ncbi:hypothetical protein EZY14_016375 [Kordia sp. TARA_039_SRF]|nr:hypothetical protein EZY14_016375 [Kordia sp. TARA_039_SRF]
MKTSIKNFFIRLYYILWIISWIPGMLLMAIPALISWLFTGNDLLKGFGKFMMKGYVNVDEL